MSVSDTIGGNRDLFGRRVAPRSGTTARQLPLPLAWSGQVRNLVAFQIGDSNRRAVEHIQRFSEWTAPASVLLGPACSGRSTLAAMFLAAEAGEVVDGLIDADEEAVFHAWNRAQTSGQKLLIIADDLRDLAGVRLPDLATRLATAPVVHITEPDTCLIRDLIEHLLVQRGLIPAPQLGSYVAARLERSYAAIHAAVDAIDAASLATGGQPGIRIARAALIEAGLYDPDENGHDSAEPDAQ